MSDPTIQGTDAPRGIDAPAVSSWFEAHVPQVTLPLQFTLVSGGRSNLTFLVTDAAGERYVLRRPPTGHLLPRAHDVAREHRIIAALAATGVPVPPALGLSEDPAINGAPFYVMRFVDGIIARHPVDIEGLDAGARRQSSLTLVDTLAAIHDVDPDAVGLGDLGRKDGYVARQLHRWNDNYLSANSARGGTPLPEMAQLHETLSAAAPEQGPATIVHGDYRLDNCILSPDGSAVLAVLDWELCTLGDPLADIGSLLVYWSEPGERSPLGDDPVTSAPGFATKAELAERYAERSGRDLSRLDFYVAFAYWKLACILEGVYARYISGAMGDDGFDSSIYPDTIDWLATRAAEAAGRLGPPGRVGG